jgi:hypothetical protein
MGKFIFPSIAIEVPEICAVGDAQSEFWDCHGLGLWRVRRLPEPHFAEKFRNSSKFRSTGFSLIAASSARIQYRTVLKAQATVEQNAAIAGCFSDVIPTMPDSDLPLLFSQLQSRYPTSSLVTELVQIHEQQFIVRALVQLGGIAIAASMAAADTIEQAEDRARSRVLTLIGISTPGALAPPSASPLTGMTAYSLQATPLSSPLDAGALPRSIPASPPLPEPLPEPLLSLNPLPAIDAISSVSIQSTASEDYLPETIAAKSSDIAKPDPAPKSRKSRAAPSPPLEETSEPVTSGNAFTGLSESPFPEEFSVVMPGFPEEPPELEADPVSTFTPSTDLSELIALTDVEMQRVGWTRKRGQTHLKQTYDKDKRADLDEEQLMEFLHFLRALPSRYEE